MLKFLHKIWNPHCPDCAAEASDKKVCPSCETLTAQLAIANVEKRQLLEAILDPLKRVAETNPVQVDMKELRAKTATWNVRRQMLEQEDRKTAAILRSKMNVQQQVNELEKELGIEEAPNVKPIGKRDEKDIQPFVDEEVS